MVPEKCAANSACQKEIFLVQGGDKLDPESCRYAIFFGRLGAGFTIRSHAVLSAAGPAGLLEGNSMASRLGTAKADVVTYALCTKPFAPSTMREKFKSSCRRVP
jgi:hypothetical protein